MTLSIPGNELKNVLIIDFLILDHLENVFGMVENILTTFPRCSRCISD